MHYISIYLYVARPVSHGPSCIGTTNPDRSVLITIITWHFQYHPVNVSNLHVKRCICARSESRFTRSSHCYITWCPLTTGIVASQFPSSEMCSERDSPLEPFVLPAPGQPELARLTCGAHLGPPVLTRKQKRPRVNSLVCDRAAAFCRSGPPKVLSRKSRLVTQAAEREWELARARSQWLKQAAASLPGESVSRGFADRGALEGYPSHYTSLPSSRDAALVACYRTPFISACINSLKQFLRQ